MDLGFKGKTVVVTGGSMGIGYGIAEEFLKEGARVFISARHKEQLDKAVKELSLLGPVEGLLLDGSREEDMKSLAQRAASVTGNIAAWVNNIGTNKKRAEEFYSEDELDYLIAANYKSCVFGTQAAVPFMKEKGGAIVNIASLAAHSATAIRSPIYASMKAAVTAYTRTSAGEYAPWGIRINVVLPGYTRTPLTEKSFSPEALDKLLQSNILNRMASVNEIARPVVFLASDQASYITATELEVTGGHMKVLNARDCWEAKAL